MTTNEVSNTTDTPRTDAVDNMNEDFDVVGAHMTALARQLERELDESKADLIRTQIEMQLEIDRSEAEVERLKALPHFHHESYCRKCGSTENVSTDPSF